MDADEMARDWLSERGVAMWVDYHAEALGALLRRTYAAGRRSVIESEEMAVVLDAAHDSATRIEMEREGYPTPEAAAIRRAVEGLR